MFPLQSVIATLVVVLVLSVGYGTAWLKNQLLYHPRTYASTDAYYKSLESVLPTMESVEYSTNQGRQFAYYIPPLVGGTPETEDGTSSINDTKRLEYGY